MSKDLLNTVYSSEKFRERGHELIDILADYLDENLNEQSPKVLDWTPPEDERLFWNDFLKEGDKTQFVSEFMKRITYIHNPKFMGHQISPAAPVTGLTGLLTALLNNGMGIYEVGNAPTAIERVVTDLLCNTIGYPKGANGFLTSGGTLANLTALLSARKSKASHPVWEEGTKTSLGIMVSEEAHYCIDRAARIMGLGKKGIIKIPANKNYSIRTDLLEEYYQKALDDKLEIFAIVGSAPCTATGIHDDLEAIAEFAANKNLWFHVDAAHGGGAIFSKQYKHLLKGAEKSDSMVIDGHKMMMMPGITTALLFSDGKNSHATFQQKADYLLDQSKEEDWYNLAKRTFECTKHMMCLHWFSLLKDYGPEVFEAFVDTLYGLGKQFASIIAEDPHFELAVTPMTNIVCFRYVDETLDQDSLNSLNEGIRQLILEEGEFYIVQTKLRGVHYLRTTIMNPFTTNKHMQELLAKIKGKVTELSIASQTP